LISDKLVLLRGADVRKDQSYFLAGLRPEQLSSIIFPLGGFKKTEVRELGRSMGIATADTKDSQDACLVSQGEPFAEMLRKRFAGNARAGGIISESGQLLGKHAGIHQFTVGQRKGIGIASTKRYWVKAVYAQQCEVMVTDTAENLMCDRLIARDMSWMVDPAEITHCQVQIRYRHQAAAAKVSVNEHGASMVVFQKPVRAITPGQAAVFYDGERVLGRGWIGVDY
jgi:tRNA-specific 2-thiouridylase